MNLKNILNNKLSKEFKASVVYTFASLMSKGLAIITMPIFTRLMSVEQIGIVNLFHSWQSMIASVVTLSLTSGGYMVAMKEYSKNRDSYMSSVLSLTSIMAILLSIIYMLNTSFWKNMTGLSMPLIVLMLVGFLVSPATDFWISRQRYEYKYMAAGAVTIISSTLASLIAVVMVIFASQSGVEELGAVRLFASCIVTYGVALILWISIMIKGKTFINKEYWSFSLKLSIPLIGNSVAMQILSVSDRTMISKMIGNYEVGIYSILYSVSSISLIIWNAINASYVPYLFENIEKKEKEGSIKKSSIRLMATYGVVAVALTLTAPEIIEILATKEYHEAIYIMPPIAAGIFLTSISNMYSNILIYYKKTKFIMISSVIAAVLNVFLNFVGIRMFGYMAAAYTTLISYILLALIQCLVSRNVHKSHLSNISVYDDKMLLLIGILTICICLFCVIIYSYTALRLLMIVLIIALVIVFRKRILAL